MTEDNSRPPMEGVGQRIDMDKTLSYMVSVMTSLIGGMATQGSSDQAMTLEDLPRWLENNAAVARKIVENFPQKVEAAPEKPVDTVSEDQWKLVISKRNGKVVGILPENDVAERWFCEEIEEEIVSKKAISSYDAAVERCREKVKSIIEDCERKNQKFRDPEFALDDQDVCLRSLVPDPEGDPYSPPPQSVARTRQIFPSPKLFVNGAKADDVRQGTGGDCWFLAAVAALTNLKEGLHHNYVHVDGDEKVGVYGFVFHRGKDAPLIADMRELTVVDGEWIYEIVDDFLYCRNPVQGRLNLENSTDAAAPSYWGNAFEARLLRSMDEEKYTNTFLSGADALYFSQCRDENETWLPLLEKAYAKAHGDYQAIEGGFTGEAIEDLTGGITTEIKTEDILDLDRMWEELLHCNQEYIFGCWTPSWPNSKGESQGLHSCHAYSVMKAQELVIDGSPQRLVLVRNPWGNSEWTGPYSDGSKEWTIDLMQKLGHRFGDDGIFWMSYRDLLRKFQLFDRTRLIGPDWSCAQCWVNFSIPRQFRFNETKFVFTLDQDDRTVISLSQLDDRYIRGLEGQYGFTLEFRLEKDGEGEILARSSSSYNTCRSVNAELDLRAGTYSLHLRIKATMDQPRAPVKDAAKTFLQQNTTKFIQIAKKYNLAFMKSGLGDEERTTKSLKEVSQSASAKEETPKQSAQPENTDAMEAPPTPGYRSMEDVKDLREEAVVSTDPPVENPITAQPEDKATDAVEETPKKKDSDWNAIATVGLRLLTRKAMVKLSAIGPDKPKGPGVIVSRQSFPIGNLPPVAGDTSGSSNISGSDTDFKQVEILTPPSETENPKSEETQQTESAKAAEEVTKQDEAADHAVVQDREETSKADASSQQEVDDVPRTQAAQPSTEQPALSVDQEPSAAKDSESPPDEKPKRFHVRF